MSCCTDNEKSLPVLIKIAASTAAAAEKAQPSLQLTLFCLTGVTAPSYLQSLDLGYLISKSLLYK
jgi:hypothetical protein